VTMGELPAAPEVLASYGFRVGPASSGPSDPGGVEIDYVVTGSPAYTAGLRPGMRILGIGNEPVATPAQFEAVARKVDVSQGLPLKVQSPDGRVGMVVLGGPGANDQP
jgi:predicted metalloprotease with PDZ domain